tara:strand:+ start:356 stop:937 length:582 start_codon:yes stop_codon:yes gene_type:complete
MLKKAAMFGLDARIALAIFGALSVISGAALYSAIQESKVVSRLTDINEFGKAWEQYYLDTGSSLPHSSTLLNSLETLNLIENDASVNNWYGPYLDSLYIDGSDVNGKWLKDSRSTGTLLRIMQIFNSDKTSVSCTSCYNWIRFDYDVSDLNIIRAMDRKIDGVEGASSGNFQYQANPGNTVYYTFYKYSSYKK